MDISPEHWYKCTLEYLRMSAHTYVCLRKCCHTWVLSLHLCLVCMLLCVTEAKWRVMLITSYCQTGHVGLRLTTSTHAEKKKKSWLKRSVDTSVFGSRYQIANHTDLTLSIRHSILAWIISTWMQHSATIISVLLHPNKAQRYSKWNWYLSQIMLMGCIKGKWKLY